MNLAVDFLTETVLAVVACGSRNHNSSVDEFTNCEAEGVILIGIHCRQAQAHVGNANVVSRGVIHQPVQCGHTIGYLAASLRIKHAKIDDPCSGSNANVLAIRDQAIASCGSRDVGTMSVRVISATLAGKVLIDHDP